MNNKSFFTIFLSLIMLLASGVYAEVNKQYLHTVWGLETVERYHKEEMFQEALYEADLFLSHELTDYERGWALLKKGTILTRINRAAEALKIYEDIRVKYAKADASGLLDSALYYERSKALSSLGMHGEAIEELGRALQLGAQAHYAAFDKEFRLQQMSIRMGRYLLLFGKPDAAVQSLQTTIQNLTRLLERGNSADLERLLHCELSVAYKELTETYIVKNDLLAALVACEMSVHYAELETPDNPKHPWQVRMKAKLQELQDRFAF